MARYGVAWPLPHEEERVSPKMVNFKAGPQVVVLKRTYLSDGEGEQAVAVKTPTLPKRRKDGAIGLWTA